MTASYAPWQNGVCERFGGVWKIAFAKAVMELDAESKEELEEIADQTTVAHNRLDMMVFLLVNMFLARRLGSQE